MWQHRDSPVLTYVIAEDPDTGEILGTVTGVDHVHAFADPENGASLWCLAVDPQAPYPGIGRALVSWLADYYHARERSYLDLSVLHDNHEAIALYESLNFRRMPIFCIKRKNPINEQLYTGPEHDDGLNPYCQIIIDEARRRGITLQLVDPELGYFQLGFGGRSISCRESLSELTSAVAMSRCADKQATARCLKRVGIRVPVQQVAGDVDHDQTFLRTHKRLVVKPADAEQGHGISVDIRNRRDLERAIRKAHKYSDMVLLEEFVQGQDLRVVVIDYAVVAAAIRRPATVIGNGRDTIAALIHKQSRRREAATAGESRIPLDDDTRQCVRRGGYETEDILPRGEVLQVRAAANLHAGGTIHDVTASLHPDLAQVCIRAAREMELPVTGLDLIVTDPAASDYVLIEANERPGLANHEPQPTAERFVDFLFPQTRRSG